VADVDNSMSNDDDILSWLFNGAFPGKMDPDKPIPEKTPEGLLKVFRSNANAAADYFDELQDAGFNRGEAFRLVLAWFTKMTGR
jgi:hypothetical protein